MSELALGPFVLEAPIGRGAMGEVWRARHRERGVPAAVKVLHGREANSARRVEAFFHEVRAVAQLDHPGIAWVFDYGTVSAEASAATVGRLLTGSPFLAMEHASHGTLETVTEACNWSEVRAVLLGLLDALAHAHSQGVIHRDLKPANVLLCSRRDVRPGIKLCDFGIAFALDDAGSPEEITGTLHYMAPEQLAGAERDQGPWTDLYALGCLTWKLLTGAPVFAGRRGLQLVMAQRNVAPPPLVTDTPLPAGFEGWLRVLLSKDPRERYRCAADAARALIELGHPAEGYSAESLRSGILHPVLRTQAMLVDHDLETVEMVRGDAPTESGRVRAGIPLDWRRVAPVRPNLDLIGAGLQLFGLRRPTFVGREQERDRLWGELIEVHRERRARAVVLRGDAGTGKSRLAMWAAERAAEVGAGVPLVARFAQSEDALRQMLLRQFAALGLEGDALRARLGKALDGIGLPAGDMRDQAIGMLSGATLHGASRYAIIRLLIEAIAFERPVVLVLDDLHVGLDGVRFARHLLNAQVVRPVPVLLLLVVSADQLAESVARGELETVAGERAVTSLDVEPLPREPFIELVQDLLGLEPELAGLVADRAAGNPLFAIQVVGDWIERDQLRLGSRGFKLKAGLRPQLPPDLKYVWVKRLLAVLNGLDAKAEPVLEVAAVLGMEVDADEWARVCSSDRASSPVEDALREAIVDRLVTLDLAERTDGGFLFTRGPFRNAILDRSRSRGRLKAHHLAAARALAVDLKERDYERFGRHLLAAGEREAALQPLLQAVPGVQATVGRMSAWRLLDTIEHAMKRLDLPREDERWGQLFLERAALADRLGQVRESAKWAAKAGREASRYRWNTIAASANFSLARHALRAGDYDMASARLVRVTNQADPERHPFLVGEALFLLGTVGRRTGETPQEVVRLMRAGKTWMLKDRDPRKRVRALLHLARAARDASDLDACAALIERARKESTRLGDLPQQVQCLAFAAEVARDRQDLVAATHALRQAIEVFELIGDAQLASLRATLATVLIERGDLATALQELERALANAVEVDRPPLLLVVHAARLHALALAGLSAQLDEAIWSVRALLPRVRVAERDSARAAERAATSCEQGGDHARAEVLRQIAAELTARVGERRSATA